MSRLPVRLEGLPRRALLELAAAGCAADARLAQRADVLLHQHQPLPKECVDAVLLSPDLLPHLFETLELCDWAAAAVCSGWAAAWAGLLQTWGAVQPKPLRVLRVPWCNYGIAVMPDSSVCVADEEFGSLKFVTPEGEELTDGGKWHELTQAEFWCPTGLLVLHGTELLVADHRRVRKLRLSDGAELARSPALPGSGELALAGDRLLVPRGGTLSVLDAETLSLRYEFGNFGCVLDCAVHGNEVFVVDFGRRGELQVFDLATGQPRRTLRGAFGSPVSINIYHDRLYLLERREKTAGDEEEDVDEEVRRWAGRRLVVLELDGSTRQLVRLPRSERLYGMHLHGDELHLTDSVAHAVHVHRILGPTHCP
eukprot:Transcript_23407.p1 GENE.Transcript_23407~~Transcript_23407.p1  ORF type:complete len:368 (-),score=115.85 Transcript_23407:35-1138(-)